MKSMRERARGYELEREREKQSARRSASLLGLEPCPATSTTHDRAHEREEAVCVFWWWYRTDLVLYIAMEGKKNSTRAHAKREE
jgi:hypothetical protein